MNYAPLVLHTNPAGSEHLPDDGFVIPITGPGKFSRCVARFLGSLTDSEKAWADRAARHNWTIRVIVDSIRARRGLSEIDYGIDWREI